MNVDENYLTPEGLVQAAHEAEEATREAVDAVAEMKVVKDAAKDMLASIMCRLAGGYKKPPQ